MKKLDELKRSNLENLLFISKKLSKFKIFCFYGTLLGLTRENDIILGDDDIDLLVDIKYKKQVLFKLSKLKKFKINKKKNNKYFIQLIKNKKHIKTFVDIYFYINRKNKKYIEEKHNFLSAINIQRLSLHIPKKYIFPLQINKNFNEVLVPKSAYKICKFLYGKNWRMPLRKNSGYRMEIINNKPKLIKRSYIGALKRRLVNFITGKFIKK